MVENESTSSPPLTLIWVVVLGVPYKVGDGDR